MSLIFFTTVFLACGSKVAGSSQVEDCAQDDDGTSLLQMYSSVSEVGNHWPHARGTIPGQFGATTTVLGKNLSAHVAWKWDQSPDGKRPHVAGGPVIDSEKNLYMMTSNDGLIKFSPEGTIQWIYKTPGYSNNQAALLGTSIFGSTALGNAFAVDIASGRELWQSKLAFTAGMDCGYPAAFDGVFVVAAVLSSRGVGGNSKIFGLNTTSGEQLWDYEPTIGVWNFMPLFRGDGSFAFMDWAGGVYRLGLHNGEEIWHTAPPGESSVSFTDGGASLDPNGLIHTCSNYGASQGGEGQKGAVRAYSLEDGKMVWEHILPQPCNSYPAVGHVRGSDALAVVHSPGAFKGAASSSILGSIMAFNAKSGEPIWMYLAPAYSGLWAGEPHCGPAHWSAPTISGDGTVYVARSDGLLYAVEGPQSPTVQEVPTNEDFLSTPGMEVETFEAGSSSLHGAMAWAPGMLGFASCDTLFVFKG